MIDKAICQPKNAKSDRQVFVKGGGFSVAKYCENTKCSQPVNKKNLTFGRAARHLARCQAKNINNFNIISLTYSQYCKRQSYYPVWLFVLFQQILANRSKFTATSLSVIRLHFFIIYLILFIYRYGIIYLPLIYLGV